ncbi:polysaccharide pyruvyl transferase family protein [Corynebacterium sp. 335C]
MSAGAGEVIVLVAPSGHPNFGDELIVAAWLRRLAAVRPDAEVVLDCHTPGTAAVLHRGLHPNLTVVNTLFRLAADADHDVRAGLVGDPPAPGPDGVPDPAELARRIAVLAADRAADPSLFPLLGPNLALAHRATTIHLAGGGWVTDLWPLHAGVVAAAATVAQVAGAMLVASGQGLVPGEALADELAPWWGRFNAVDVRDAGSEALVPPGPQLSRSGDDAWLDPGDGAGPFGPGPEAARDRGIVVCAQSDLLAGGPDELAGHVAAALRAWGAEGRDIAVVECVPGADAQVWERVAELAPELDDGCLRVGFGDLWAEGLPARPGQRWLTTRYHPHLLAAARGASGVAVDAHVGGYYAAKHGAVRAAGSGWPIVAPAGLAGAEPGPGMDARDAAVARAAKETLADRFLPPERGLAGLGRWLGR